MLNYDKLKEGMKFNTYKEMCEFLGTNPKKGDSLTRQKKDFGEYFKFKQLKNRRVIIEEVYEVKRVREDKRGTGNNTKYADDLEFLLLEILAKNTKKDCTIGMSRTALYTQSKMVNSNYKQATSRREILAQALNVPLECVVECIEVVDGKLYNTLESTLKRVQAKAVIKYGNSYNVRRIGEEGFSLATREEREIILVAEGKSMDELNCKTKRAIYTNGLSKVHRKITQKYLAEAGHTYILDFYDSLEITVAHDRLLRELKAIRERYKKEEQQTKKDVEKNLNKKINSGLDRTIAYRHNKAKSIEAKDYLDVFRASDEYVSNQKEVKEAVVNAESKKINLDQSLDTEKSKSRSIEFKKKYYVDKNKNVIGEQGTFDLFVDYGDIPF